LDEGRARGACSSALRGPTSRRATLLPGRLPEARGVGRRAELPPGPVPREGRAAEPARTVGAEPGCEVLDLWPKHVPGPALDLRKWHPLRPGDLHQETVTGLMPVERVSVAPALSGVGPELGSTAGPAVPGDQALEPCDPVLEVVRCPDLLAERPEISVPAVVAALAVLVEVLELCRPLVQRVSVVARD